MIDSHSMEMPVLSQFTTDFTAYSKQRLFQPRIVLLIGLLWAAALWVELTISWPDAVVRSLILGLLMLEFRLWDDLADRAFDQLHHSDRILGRIPDIASFRTVLWGALVATAVLTVVFLGAWSFGLFVALVLSFHVLYVDTWRVTLPRFVRTQLVLLKYPAFLTLVTESVSIRLLVMAALVYFLLSLNEWRDDIMSRRANRS